MNTVDTHNWILPINGEFYEHTPTHQVRVMALESMFSRERAPIFEDMQKRFWTNYFLDWTATQLRNNAKLVGLLPGKSTKAELLKMMVEYARDLVGGN
jgi:hypothetical protein